MSSKKEKLLDQIEVQRAIDEVTSMSEEQLDKELADAGIDMKKQDARMEALFAKHGVKATPAEKPPEPAKVVSLETRRKRPRFMTAWLVAAALGAIAASTVAITVATRDEEPGDTRVASPLCTPVGESMTLDGKLEKRGDAFVLHLDLALCAGGADEVKLVAPDGVDLAPLVGRAVHVEGKPFGVDARTVVVKHATAKEPPP